MSRTFVDIEAVREVLADVKDCEDKQYALALLEWAIDKRTVSEAEIRADERAKTSDEFARAVNSRLLRFVHTDYDDILFIAEQLKAKTSEDDKKDVEA